MSTNAEYEAKISQCGWDDLINLWTAIELGNTKTLGWDAGKALEYLVLRAFQLDGADVTWPYSVRVDGEEIEQIDGVIYVASLACLIECKDMDKPAKIEPIAKLRNQLLRRPATTIGSIVSRKGFTEAAETLAGFVAPQTILLWVGSEIKYSLENKCISKALLKKYRFCIEQGLPNYNITIEVL